MVFFFILILWFLIWVFCILDLMFLMYLEELIFFRCLCFFFVIYDVDFDCFCVVVFCCNCFEGNCSKFGEEIIFLIFVLEFEILFDFFEGFGIL